MLFPSSRPRGLPAPAPDASGPPLCRAFTVRGARNGVPHANRATWVSNVPRFCGPAKPKPGAARKPGDLDPQRTDKTPQIQRTRDPGRPRRFVAAGPQKRVTFETQVARFACGTRILSHWTVKTRHNGGPEAPGGAAGKPREHESGKNTSERHTGAWFWR